MLTIQLEAIDRVIEMNKRRSRPIEDRLARQRLVEESLAKIDKVIDDQLAAEKAGESSDAQPDPQAATDEGPQPKRSFQDPTAQWPPGEPVRFHPGVFPPTMEKVTDDEFDLPEDHSGRH